MSAAIRVGSDVQEALDSGKSIVALESTIIAHGMPYPTNLETALEVERIIRSEGATPATIGIVDGVLTCGLSFDEIELFATSSDIEKATGRDLAAVLYRKYSAATTVGASLSVASSLGIHVLVTGGIGGVAQDAGQNFDISADLIALARYPCIVVSSGTKAFMDIPATLEYFETHGILIVGFQSEYFPLFWSRSSGLKIDWVVNNEHEVAEIFQRKLEIEQGGSLFVGVPVPEEDAIAESETARWVSLAIDRVRAEGIKGKAVTPALLRLIDEASEGSALRANTALIKNNAAVGARIAIALADTPSG